MMTTAAISPNSPSKREGRDAGVPLLMWALADSACEGGARVSGGRGRGPSGGDHLLLQTSTNRHSMGFFF